VKAFPGWAEDDFRAYPGSSPGQALRCGILAHGFARARCGECGAERLIAFSCKGRGVCPSCNTRRMVEVAAHLHRFGSALNPHFHLHLVEMLVGRLNGLE
jgi:hypothetical protein